MEYTINVADEEVLAYEAAQGGLTNQGWIEQFVNGKLTQSRPNYLANEAGKAKAEYDAKVAAYDTAKPTLDKIAALDAENAKLVQDILDGKVVATDVTAKP